MGMDCNLKKKIGQFFQVLSDYFGKIAKKLTVEPVYNGHPRDLSNWPLNTGGRLMQDH